MRKRMGCLYNALFLFFIVIFLFYVPHSAGQEFMDYGGLMGNSTFYETYHDNSFYDSTTFQSFNDLYSTQQTSLSSSFYSYPNSSTLSSADYLTDFNSSYSFFPGSNFIFNPFIFSFPWFVPYRFPIVIIIEDDDKGFYPEPWQPIYDPGPWVPIDDPDPWTDPYPWLPIYDLDPSWLPDGFRIG